MLSTPSPNCDERPNGMPIDMLVLHYTGMPTGEEALARLTDIEHEVVHITWWRKTAVSFSLYRRHSVRGMPASLIGADTRSECALDRDRIGKPGHDFGYRPFPELQMMALETLALDILARHPIPSRNVVGHSDIAPTRKIDPGELFDWRGLAAKGIGMWPARAATGPRNVMDALEDSRLRDVETILALWPPFSAISVRGNSRRLGSGHALLAARHGGVG